MLNSLKFRPRLQLIVIPMFVWGITIQRKRNNNSLALKSIGANPGDSHPVIFQDSDRSTCRKSCSGTLFSGLNIRLQTFLLLQLLFVLLAFAGKTNAQSSQTIIISGAYTFTAPAGITSVTVECWGGGGRGAQQGVLGSGGGGGGGAYSSSVIAVIPGNSYPITVGAGSTTTSAGGDSWFLNASTLLAKGGNSVADNESTGASGGALGLGDIRFSGGSGAKGIVSGGGGGGSSAGPAANGSHATSENGATAPPGGGSGGNGSIVPDGPGQAGSGPGGGGGGAYRTNAGLSEGGPGIDGQVIISWTCTSYTILSISIPPVCSGNTATVTLTSSPEGLPVGAYLVTYNLGAPNASNGNTAILTVSPPGTGTFTTEALLLAGNTSITVTNLESGSGSQRCSNPLTINQNIEVIQQPSITSQPQDVRDCEDRSVNFKVIVSGTVSAYTWQRKRPVELDFSDIPLGETGISYPAAGTIKVENVGGNANPDGTKYRVVVTHVSCSITSEEAILSVNEITALSGGTNVTQCYGSNYSYSVTTSFPAKTFQWKKSVTSGNWTDITNGGPYSGATTNQLNISGGTPDESGEYRVYMSFDATGADCNVSSDGRNRKLTFLPALSAQITTGIQSICANTLPAQLTATASGGSGTFSFQWEQSSDNLSWTSIVGANTLTYQPPVITGSVYYRITVTDAGTYLCGTASSPGISVTANPLPITSLIYHN